MAKLAGAALKFFQTFLYAACFCCAGLILAFYSYFLAVQADRDINIPRWEKAVEGISGVACVYSAFAVILTCCIGGVIFFAFLAIILDLLFVAGFVTLAVLTRDGTRSCDASTVYTPLGNGPPDSKNGWGNSQHTYSVHLGLVCKYNKACFAVAIIGAFLFAIAALIQLFLGRHHQREKRYGPSPANNYTSGSGGRFWRRNRRPRTTHQVRDAELATAGALPIADKHSTIRPSHETGYTGSTVATPTTAAYDSHGKPVTPVGAPLDTEYRHSGNPYGYENTPHAAHHTAPHTAMNY